MAVINRLMSLITLDEPVKGCQWLVKRFEILLDEAGKVSEDRITPGHVLRAVMLNELTEKQSKVLSKTSEQFKCIRKDILSGIDEELLTFVKSELTGSGCSVEYNRFLKYFGFLSTAKKIDERVSLKEANEMASKLCYMYLKLACLCVNESEPSSYAFRVARSVHGSDSFTREISEIEKSDLFSDWSKKKEEVYKLEKQYVANIPKDQQCKRSNLTRLLRALAVRASVPLDHPMSIGEGLWSNIMKLSKKIIGSGCKTWSLKEHTQFKNVVKSTESEYAEKFKEDSSIRFVSSLLLAPPVTTTANANAAASPSPSFFSNQSKQTPMEKFIKSIPGPTVDLVTSVLSKPPKQQQQQQQQKQGGETGLKRPSLVCSDEETKLAVESISPRESLSSPRRVVDKESPRKESPPTRVNNNNNDAVVSPSKKRAVFVASTSVATAAAAVETSISSTVEAENAVVLDFLSDDDDQEDRQQPGSSSNSSKQRTRSIFDSDDDDDIVVDREPEISVSDRQPDSNATERNQGQGADNETELIECEVNKGVNSEVNRCERNEEVMDQSETISARVLEPEDGGYLSDVLLDGENKGEEVPMDTILVVDDCAAANDNEDIDGGNLSDASQCSRSSCYSRGSASNKSGSSCSSSSESGSEEEEEEDERRKVVVATDAPVVSAATTAVSSSKEVIEKKKNKKQQQRQRAELVRTQQQQQEQQRKQLRARADKVKGSVYLSSSPVKRKRPASPSKYELPVSSCSDSGSSSCSSSSSEADSDSDAEQPPSKTDEVCRGVQSETVSDGKSEEEVSSAADAVAAAAANFVAPQIVKRMTEMLNGLNTSVTELLESHFERAKCQSKSDMESLADKMRKDSEASSKSAFDRIKKLIETKTTTFVKPVEHMPPPSPSPSSSSVAAAAAATSATDRQVVLSDKQFVKYLKEQMSMNMKPLTCGGNPNMTLRRAELTELTKMHPKPQSLSGDSPASLKFFERVLNRNRDDKLKKRLKKLSPEEFTYFLLYLNEKTAATTGDYEIGDEPDTDKTLVNASDHHMSNRICHIANKLCDAVNKDEKLDIAEMALFRVIDLIGQLCSGSNKRVSHLLRYKEKKSSADKMREALGQKSMCVVCKARKVNVGFVDHSRKIKNTMVMMFCGHCLSSDLKGVKEMLPAGVSELDLFPVSYQGVSLTVSKTEEMISESASGAKKQKLSDDNIEQQAAASASSSSSSSSSKKCKSRKSVTLIDTNRNNSNIFKKKDAVTNCCQTLVPQTPMR